MTKDAKKAIKKIEKILKKLSLEEGLIFPAHTNQQSADIIEKFAISKTESYRVFDGHEHDHEDEEARYIEIISEYVSLTLEKLDAEEA